MTTITLKNIPTDLYDLIKANARRNRRSINSEILFQLEKAIKVKKINVDNYLTKLELLHNNLSLPELNDDILNQARNEGRP